MRTHRVDWYHHLPPHVKGILTTLQSAGFESYVVGGSVRDLWLGLKPKDFDLASSATPEEIEKLFARTEDVGRQFGIMIVVTEEGSVEVARFRADAEYKDGRHPTGVVFSSPEEDAKRRDFTINALFYDPTKGEVIDYVGGIEDIEACSIRCVGDAKHRIEEDSLRMLRAVRFHAQFAQSGFALDRNLIDAVCALHERLALVSRERITQELSKIFLSPRPSIGLFDLVQMELWEGVFGKAVPNSGTFNRFDSIGPLFLSQFQREPGLPLYVAAAARWLSGWEPEKSLVLTKDAKAAALAIPKVLPKLANYQQLSLAEKKLFLNERFYPEAWAVLFSESSGQAVDALHAMELDRLRWHAEKRLDPPALVNGTDLIALGFSPGPDMKKILEEIRMAQLNEEIDDKQEAIEILKKRKKSWISA
ncbi:MAG TPA: CCA tRNA nucleotidyltransferase [Bdellovibrionota bacterium]|jgi:tRNA nucleotidyltransferase/poly(A) polymerase